MPSPNSKQWAMMTHEERLDCINQLDMRRTPACAKFIFGAMAVAFWCLLFLRLFSVM